MRSTRSWLAALLAGALLAGGCSHSPKSSSHNASSPNSSMSPFPTITRYQQAVDAAARRKLQVWLEGDLLKRWLEGPKSFNAAVGRLSKLASRPGVVGIKIADELGYHNGLGADPGRVRAFLTDAARSIRLASPGRQILVDILVPELGCAPGLRQAAGPAALCRARARAEYPALTLEQVDSYFASGTVDVVDLSTGLLPDSTYRAWGIDRRNAQEAAWREAVRRGWPGEVKLQSRRALAHPGDYPGNAATADSDVQVFVDIPTHAGAVAVNIWTWRQLYRGQVVRLLDPGLRPNPLWAALQARRRAGVKLLTSFSPSSTERNVDTDLAMITQVFSGVFVAAGIG